VPATEGIWECAQASWDTRFRTLGKMALGKVSTTASRKGNSLPNDGRCHHAEQTVVELRGLPQPRIGRVDVVRSPAQATPLLEFGGFLQGAPFRRFGFPLVRGHLGNRVHRV
jgi:hypothetical protein